MAAQKKAVYASGEKVFTRIGKGHWEAHLYCDPVRLERVRYDHWQCVDEKTDKVLGEGSTRNEAMREAFYNVAQDQGYDKDEAKRLEWILVEQPYRSYGGHKPRCKTVNVENVKGYKNVKKIVRNDKEATEDTPYDPVQMLRNELEHYKTAYNKVLGGWLYYRRDGEGNIEGGIKGPFKTQKEMLQHMIKNAM